jgi:hypothetical protein
MSSPLCGSDCCAWGVLGCVVVAAAGHSEDVADRADAVAGGFADVVNHFAELAWGLVPQRMTAALFEKISKKVLCISKISTFPQHKALRLINNNKS